MIPASPSRVMHGPTPDLTKTTNQNSTTQQADGIKKNCNVTGDV
jgi:hypothetical protein